MYVKYLTTGDLLYIDIINLTTNIYHLTIYFNLLYLDIFNGHSLLWFIIFNCSSLYITTKEFSNHTTTVYILYQPIKILFSFCVRSVLPSANLELPHPSCFRHFIVVCRPFVWKSRFLPKNNQYAFCDVILNGLNINL